MTAAAYVGVGSNLGNPATRVRAAIEALRALGQVRASSLYRTEPLGDPGQPWYLNAVCELRTGLAPEPLLAELQSLERRAGRPEPRVGWGPRVLDLDLLLFVVFLEGLTICLDSDHLGFLEFFFRNT